MNDFSLIGISEKIYFSKTRQYFEEVKRSYISKNYRSAIVILYSVLICDIIYKLKELIDRFDDEVAKKIIDEIEDFQRKHPSNPDWEKKLIEFTKDRTTILKPSDYTNIIMLQQHRHLCSHPVLEGNYELYHPNKETTLAHIRNISQEILVKPPLFTRKIINSLLLDLESVKDIFIREEDELLERYLESKYFKHATPSIMLSIFKSLWKIVYKLEDDKCNENRIINSKAIRILFKKNYNLFIKQIKAEQDYFSDIKHGSPIYFLIGLMSQNPEIYSLLNDSAKILIQQSIDSDRVIRSMAWFKFSNLKDHLAWIKEEESKESFITLHLNTVKAFTNAYIEAGLKDELYELFIWLYEQSKSFNISANRFSLIRYILNDLSKDQILKLLTAIESNKNNYKNTIYSFNELKSKSDQVLGKDFEYTPYPNFMKKIK